MAGASPKPYVKEVVDIYEAGKGRRYGLLFSANGGAYAIAAFLAEFRNPAGGLPVDAFGLILLAAFMTLFNLLMWMDIHAFGVRMREIDQAIRGVGAPWLLFGRRGAFVLAAFCAGLALAWLCVCVGGVLAASGAFEPPANAAAQTAFQFTF